MEISRNERKFFIISVDLLQGRPQVIELFESQGKKLFEEVGCSFQGIVDCLDSKFGAVFLPR